MSRTLLPEDFRRNESLRQQALALMPTLEIMMGAADAKISILLEPDESNALANTARLAGSSYIRKYKDILRELTMPPDGEPEPIGGEYTGPDEFERIGREAQAEGEKNLKKTKRK